jgi:hypothetical protein
MDTAIAIVLWFLVFTGLALWVGIAVVLSMLIYGKLDKRYWLRFNMRTLFVIATIIAVAAGIMETGRRLWISKILIRHLDQKVMELKNEQ